MHGIFLYFCRLSGEFKSVKNVIGKMSFIYADAVSHRIVDVVADRKLKSLKDHFYRYSLKLRQKSKQ